MGSLNAINNTVSNSDFSVNRSDSGTAVVSTVEHSDNTAANVSSSVVAITCAGTTQIGDPYIVWNTGSTDAYAMGIDTSDTQSLKITYAAAATVTPSSTQTIFTYEPTTDVMNFTVETTESRFSSAANNVTFQAVNTETANASSSASVGAQVLAPTAGDPFFQLDISGATTNKFGLDNSDSDKFKYMVGSTAGNPLLEGNEAIEMTQAGEITYPLQPGFLAFTPVTLVNQTGGGAIATVGFATELFDVGSDFAVNIFTAPVTGKYSLGTQVILFNVVSANVGSCRIVTSNRSFHGGGSGSPTAKKDIVGDIALFLTTFTDMDAGDTAFITCLCDGQGANTIGFLGDATPNCFFYGKLDQ